MLKADPEFKRAMQSKLSSNPKPELETAETEPANNTIADAREPQANPGHVSSQQVISLQRTLGNQATIHYLNQRRQQTGQGKVIQRALEFDASWNKGMFSGLSGYDPATAQAELSVPFDQLKTSVQEMRGMLDKSTQLGGWNKDLRKLETFINTAEAKPITYSERQAIKNQIAEQAEAAATLKANIESTIEKNKKAEEEKEKRRIAHEALMEEQKEQKRQKAEAEKLQLELAEKAQLEEKRLAEEEKKRQAVEAEKLRVEQEQKLLAAKQLQAEKARLEEEARLKAEELQKKEEARLLKEQTKKAFEALEGAAATLKATKKPGEARRILDEGNVPTLLEGYNTAQANANAAYNVAKSEATRSLATIELANQAFKALEKAADQVISTYLSDPAVRKARIRQAADWLCAEKGENQKILIAEFRSAAEKFRLDKDYGEKIRQKYQELYGSDQQKAHIATMKTPDQKILTKGAAVSAYISKLLANGKISPDRVVGVYRTGSDPAPKYSIKVKLNGMTAHVLHAHMTGAHTVAAGPDPVHLKKTTGGTKEIGVASYKVNQPDFATILPPQDRIRAAREQSDLTDD